MKCEAVVHQTISGRNGEIITLDDQSMTSRQDRGIVLTIYIDFICIYERINSACVSVSIE